jgi:Domain of unknown function (DUF4349)
MTLAHTLGESRWLSLTLGGLVLFVAAALFRPHSMQAPAPPTEGKPLAAPVQTYTSNDQERELRLSIAGRVSTSKELAPGSSTPTSPSAVHDRKIIRTGSLEAVVKSPAEAAEQIRNMAENLGGYVESAQVSSSQSAPTATITIRVPAARFEDAKAEIRKFTVRIESEKTDASDVTKQYVDLQARIRNLRAEEAQYLTIMKNAGKIPDMLAVSEKLSDVRGEIEQQQAEFETLSKQVETVAITISLRSEVEAQVAGLHWRPLYQLKLAVRDALDGMADYANTMLGVIFYIPVVMLWVMTLVFGAASTWKLLRWGARVLFDYPKAVAAASKT